jgi:putative sigma-54 modulation protein
VGLIKPKPATASATKVRGKRVAHSISVNTTFRHLESSPAIQEYTERKFGQIAKFLKKDANVHVILSVDKYRHCGEATVKTGHLTLKTAYVEGRDLYAVIDGLAAKVKRQVTEHLNKIKQSRTRALPASTVLGGGEEVAARELKSRQV